MMSSFYFILAVALTVSLLTDSSKSKDAGSVIAGNKDWQSIAMTSDGPRLIALS
ncbi:MAG: hypothetical protein [Olavius algarvensis spirochete endosymbiont]|nr:MAG: hypothetical protein [Olavius algarvensis spirochete endosymbiont]